MRLIRCEFWSNLECAGGTALCTIPDLVAAEAIFKVSDVHELTLTLPASSAALAHYRTHRVVRTRYADGSYDEWRLRTRRARHTPAGPMVTLTALWPSSDLARVGPVTRADADGAVTADFEAAGLTPSQHLSSFVLPFLAAKGFPYYALGTIEATTARDLVYRGPEPLDVLRQLATDTKTEWQLRRSGTTNYVLELLNRIGAEAALVDVRLGRNLLTLDLDESGDEQCNVLVGLGADLDQVRGTIAQNRWRVTNISGNTLTMADPVGADPPIAYDDQLNERYVQLPGGAGRTRIADSIAATQELVVDSAAAFLIGNLVQVVANAAGDDLTELSAPPSLTLYPRLAGVVERPDIPDVVNLVPNSVMRNWAGGTSDPPDQWATVGGPVPTRNTDPRRWRTGGQSWRLQTDLDAEGGRTPSVAFTPTPARPHLNVVVHVWVETGSVRAELVVTNGADTIVVPDGTEGRARIPARQEWSELVVVDERTDFAAFGATSFFVRVVQDGVGTADFYWDAVQVSQDSFAQPLVEVSGANLLWQAVNRELPRRQDPGVGFEPGLLDLSEVDPSIWASYGLVLGGDIRIRDPDLNIDGTSRILALTRNLMTGVEVRPELSRRSEDVIERLIRPPRAVRSVSPQRIETTPSIEATIDPVDGQPGQARVRLAAQPEDSDIFYSIADWDDPVPLIGAAAYLPYPGPFVVNRLQTEELQLMVYAERSGRSSGVRRWRIDRDTTPTVIPGLTENPGGTLVIGYTPDDDVVWVRAYARRNGAGNGWPTTNNNSDGPLDEAFFLGIRHVNPDGGGWDATGISIPGGTTFTHTGYSNGDVGRVILVPIDRRGNKGPRALAQRTMAGSTSPMITVFTLDSLVDAAGGALSAGEVIHGRISYNANVSVGYDLRILMSVDGAPYVQVNVVADPQAGSPIFQSTGYIFRSQKFDPLRSFRFKGELIDGALTILDSRETQILSITTDPAL